jgi:cell division transport system ATP-binding protein
MRNRWFEEQIAEFKTRSDSEVLEFLSSYWNITPDEKGVFTMVGTYKKADHKDKKGNDFAYFEDVRNTEGDILYYPFGLGKVKLWTACNDKLEKQDIWRISVKLSPKKFRDKNPFIITLSDTKFGLPSTNLKDKLSREAQIRKIFKDTGFTERDAKNTVNALHNIMDDLYSNADDRFVYELLQNADDQPEEGAQGGQTSKNLYASLDNDSSVVPHVGTPTISLQNVTMIYPAQPNKPALDDVSIDIYPGEFVFVVGHSGSGKSTFLRLLTRELRATKGSVLVSGQNLTKMRNWKVPYLRRQIGTVYQDFKLLPDKTVYGNVAFALECIGKPRSVIKTQVPEVLRLVGLAEKMDNYPDQLSGGEQQRVSVARAMVNRPPLLVCDEPTGNLDPAISLGIMKLLDRINRTGTTVVMATHDREMVDAMHRRVIALEAGHVVRDQERGGYGFYDAL